MVRADSELIRWLLHDSGISRYQISKEVGITEATLSRITHGETPMDRVSFGYAHKLTEYARKVKQEQVKQSKQSDNTERG